MSDSIEIQLLRVKDADVEQAKELLKDVGIDYKNQLLVSHLVDKSNLKIAKLLLQNGADANYITKANDSGSTLALYDVKRETAAMFGGNFYQNEPLAITVCYADGFFANENNKTISLLPQKISLLIEHGLNVNVKNKFGEPLMAVIVDKLVPLWPASDEFKTLYEKAVSKTVAILLGNNVVPDKAIYKNDKNVFKDALYHIGGMSALKELKRGNNSYGNYIKIMTDHIGENKEKSLL